MLRSIEFVVGSRFVAGCRSSHCPLSNFRVLATDVNKIEFPCRRGNREADLSLLAEVFAVNVSCALQDPELSR